MGAIYKKELHAIAAGYYAAAADTVSFGVAIQHSIKVDRKSKSPPSRRRRGKDGAPHSFSFQL